MNNIHRPLNSILSTKAKVGALRVLSRTKAELTGREVAKLANVSVPQTLNALGELVQMGIVTRQSAGRAGLYALNRRIHLVRRGILPLFQAEKTMVEDGIETIAKVLKDISSASITLFGSRARGDALDFSDVDLLVVLKNKTPQITETIQTQMQKATEKTGIRFECLIMSEQECRKAKGKKRHLLQNIISEGRNLKGKNLKEIIDG